MDPSDEKKEMDPEAKDSSQCVRVAVNIRPLVTPELLVGCTDCISVVPGEPKVQIRTQAFTFDYVFGSTGLPSYSVFDKCVAPLVDALFQGYNGTVLAYGQTGSGKSYTMGTNYNGDEDDQSCGGVIPKVMETIYSRVDALKDSTEFLIRVSFIEIHNEEVFDLLDPNPLAISKADGMSLAKPARSPIQMRETVNGGITLAGVTESEVRTKEEMATLLLRGSVSRATGSTNMNSQSSLSHAIFTISMEQKRIASSRSGDVHDDDDILSAKLHLVDLAGSESAKCSGADGMRLREGIHISKGLLALGNVISALGDDKKRKAGGHVPYRVSKWTRLLHGLLALGNVISALGDDRKRKEGGHVPYRDSKLTHLLQDSLGGNSKTVMIACVSPADTNAEETLNTLKYAERARNIQNKAVINRDPMAAQMQRMRNQIELLQSEVQHKDSLLEASNAELQRVLQERQISFDHLAQTCLDAQVDMDTSVLKQTYEKKVQELEMEKRALQKENEELRHNLASISSTSDDGAQKLKTDVGYYGLRPKGSQNCGIPCEGNSDIDTSDSGHSDMDRDDEDYRPPTYISNPSRSKSLPVSSNVSEGLNPHGEGGEDSLTQKNGSLVSCPCSKNSHCKTAKCVCRNANCFCGMACECYPDKCVNRKNKRKEPSALEAVVGSSDETWSSKLLETN